ncbi:MAG: hypothetical protein AAGF59_01580 [Pseudomonadota bacterium]
MTQSPLTRADRLFRAPTAEPGAYRGPSPRPRVPDRLSKDAWWLTRPSQTPGRSTVEAVAGRGSVLLSKRSSILCRLYVSPLLHLVLIGLLLAVLSINAALGKARAGEGLIGASFPPGCASLQAIQAPNREASQSQFTDRATPIPPAGPLRIWGQPGWVDFALAAALVVLGLTARVRRHFKHRT